MRDIHPDYTKMRLPCMVFAAVDALQLLLQVSIGGAASCQPLAQTTMLKRRWRDKFLVQATPGATSSVTDSVDSEAEATLAELRSTTQRSDQEVVHVSHSWPCPRASHGHDSLWLRLTRQRPPIGQIAHACIALRPPIQTLYSQQVILRPSSCTSQLMVSIDSQLRRA